MHPILFRIPLPGSWGTLPLYSYGVMLGFSLVVGWHLTLTLAERDGLPKETMANNYVVTAIAAVVGSRILYILTNLHEFDTFASIFAMRRGGLVAYGGFLGGLVGSILFLRRHKIPLLPWADVAVPSLASGLMITRIGCYMFGCDFGQPLSENSPDWLKSLGRFPHWPKGTLDAGDGSPAWMQHVNQRGLSRDAPFSIPVHPTQIYESLVGLCLLGLLLYARKKQKFRGQIFCLFFFAYGIARYVLEILRDDNERGSLPPALPEHILLPLGLALFAAGYCIGFSQLIEHPIIRRTTQVLAFFPAAALYLALKPESFALDVVSQYSTSQAIAIVSGVGGCALFSVLYKAALAHPTAAMDLGLPKVAVAGAPAAALDEDEDDEDEDDDDEAPRRPAKRLAKKAAPKPAPKAKASDADETDDDDEEKSADDAKADESADDDDEKKPEPAKAKAKPESTEKAKPKAAATEKAKPAAKGDADDKAKSEAEGLVVAAYGGRSVTRYNKDGSITVLADRWDSKRFDGPNDVTVRHDDSIYFSDAISGLRLQDKDPSREMPSMGIYRIKDGKVTRILRDLVWANGLTFSPDEKWLYANNTRVRNDISRYKVLADGNVDPNGEVLIELDAQHAREGRPAEPGVADGLKVDTKGNLWSTGPGGMWILNSEGKHLGTILTPEIIANFTFGDADYKTLYLNGRTTIYKIRINVAGIPCPSCSPPAGIVLRTKSGRQASARQ